MADGLGGEVQLLPVAVRAEEVAATDHGSDEPRVGLDCDQRGVGRG